MLGTNTIRYGRGAACRYAVPEHRVRLPTHVCSQAGRPPCRMLGYRGTAFTKPHRGTARRHRLFHNRGGRSPHMRASASRRQRRVLGRRSAGPYGRLRLRPERTSLLGQLQRNRRRVRASHCRQLPFRVTDGLCFAGLLPGAGGNIRAHCAPPTVRSSAGAQIRMANARRQRRMEHPTSASPPATAIRVR